MLKKNERVDLQEHEVARGENLPADPAMILDLKMELQVDVRGNPLEIVIGQEVGQWGNRNQEGDWIREKVGVKVLVDLGIEIALVLLGVKYNICEK